MISAHLAYLKENYVFERCKVCRREVMPHNIEFVMVWKDIVLPRRTRGKRTFPARQFRKYSSVNACFWCCDAIKQAHAVGGTR